MLLISGAWREPLLILDMSWTSLSVEFLLDWTEQNCYRAFLFNLVKTSISENLVLGWAAGRNSRKDEQNRLRDQNKEMDGEKRQCGGWYIASWGPSGSKRREGSPGADPSKLFFHTASLLLIYRLTIRLSAAEEEEKGADGEIKQKRKENVWQRGKHKR